MRFERYDGAGNRFLLLDAPGSAVEPGDLARLACARPSFDGPHVDGPRAGGQRADGLLLLSREADGARRLVVHNADGGRPEACGNGLRCAAWHLLRAGSPTPMVIRTDAGERRVALVSHVGALASLRASMGRATVGELTRDLPAVDGLLGAQRVSVGNPHCVLRVADERLSGLDALGREMQGHPDFPHGVNVGLLARRAGSWRLRVFERGVGETEACGTGACAAVAAIGEEAAPLGEEASIEMRGGTLRVLRALDGELELTGVATHRGACELELTQGVG